MSDCSSPTSSHRSSCSGFSSGPRSPETLFTTPSESREGSPKLLESFQSSTVEPTHGQLHTYPYSTPSSPPFVQYNSTHVSTSTSYHSSPLETHMDEPVFFTPQYSELDQSPHYQETTFWTKDAPQYSGYPPASAFYGPPSNFQPQNGMLGSCTSSPSQPSPFGYANDQTPVDPFEYQVEEWYTADGRRVEYSAMALGCATM